MLFESWRVRRAADRAGLTVGRYPEGYRVEDLHGTEVGGYMTAKEIIACARWCDEHDEDYAIF